MEEVTIIVIMENNGYPVNNTSEGPDLTYIYKRCQLARHLPLCRQLDEIESLNLSDKRTSGEHG